MDQREPTALGVSCGTSEGHKPFFGLLRGPSFLVW